MVKTVFIYLIIITCLFHGCGIPAEKDYSETGKGKKFEIEGNVVNGAGKKLYLKMLGASQLKNRDSVIIDRNGDFQITSVTNYPNLFILQTETGNFFSMCINGGEKIKVKSDYNNFTNYSISGSEESEQIHKLVQKTREILTQVDQLSRMSQDSINSPDYTAIKSKISNDFENYRNELRAYSIEFIKNNNNSLVSLLALKNQIGPQMYVLHPLNDKEIFQQVDSTLTATYPKSELVSSFHNELASFLSQLEAQNPVSGILSEGQSAPEIALPSPNGKIIKLSSLKGKYVLLDFWAAWCPPCRAENPNLVANYKKYHSKGFEIYQVSLDRTKEDWLKGINDDKLEWLHVSDLKYWNSMVVSLYGISGIPMNYLLDKDGKVITSNLRGPALGEKLGEIFNQ